MEEYKTEKVKLSKEDIDDTSREIAYEALIHLKRLTETYIENVHKMSTTYKKEFAFCEMGFTLSISLGSNPVVVTALGSANAIKSSVANIMKAMLAHSMKEDANE